MKKFRIIERTNHLGEKKYVPQIRNGFGVPTSATSLSTFIIFFPIILLFCPDIILVPFQYRSFMTKIYTNKIPVIFYVETELSFKQTALTEIEHAKQSLLLNRLKKHLDKRHSKMTTKIVHTQC